MAPRQNTGTNQIGCPFECGFSHDDEYVLQLHIEETHTDDSPFVVRESSPLAAPSTENNETAAATTERQQDEFVLCPNEECGEVVLLFDLQEHLDLHAAEFLSYDDLDTSGEKMSPSPAYSLPGHQPSTHRSLKTTLKRSVFSPPRKHAGQLGVSLTTHPPPKSLPGSFYVVS